MTLRQLEYFRAIVEYRSITLAAEKLYITQPALTKQLQLMENELGFQLISRKHKQITLTPEGEYFYRNASAQLDAFDNMLKDSIEFSRNNKPPVMVAHNSNMQDWIAVPVLKQFKNDCPNYDLQLVRLNMKEAMNQLSKQQLDIIFCMDRHTMLMKNLVFLPMLEGSFYCVMQKAHPLAGRDSLGLDELTGLDIISPNPSISSSVYSEINEKLRSLGNGTILHESSNSVSSLTYIRAYNWVGILPFFSFSQAITPDLISVPINGLPKMRFGIVRQSTNEKPQVMAFWKSAQTAAEKGFRQDLY